MAKILEGFVDIHTHILPGVDDGATDLSRSIALLRRAWKNGTKAVVLTPHYRGRYRGNVADKLEPVFRELCQTAEEHCPGMRLYLGCEVGYEMDVAEKIAAGAVMTLNGTRYVLLEFRDHAFRSRIMDGVLEILNFGYIPIVAHVERCEAIRKHPAFARELTELGALLQINADSVMGRRGFALKHYCYMLMRKRCVHFIATDAHDMEHRTPDLGDCYEKIKKRYGADYAAALFYTNARTMLSGGEDIEC